MGVNGPLHWGGSLRWVAHAARLATASVKVHREMTASQFLGLLGTRGKRMGDSSEVPFRTGRDLGDR
jgi:hypothetical protein